MPDEYEVEAQVHTAVANGGYRVKVWIKSLGLYLNGAMVFPNTRADGEKWIMFPPSYTIGKYKKTFYPAEFDRDVWLWQELSAAAFLAVEEFIRAGSQEHSHSPDDIFTDPLLDSDNFDEDIRRQLDEVTKSFGIE